MCVSVSIMCMYLRVSVCVGVCTVCIGICICYNVIGCTRPCVTNVYVSLHLDTCVCVYAYSISTCACLCTCTCVCMYVCSDVCSVHVRMCYM